MKKIILPKVLISILFFLPKNLVANESFYQKKILSAQGKEIKIGAYKGKSLLIVNIATRCGYTHQLKGLEDLYQKFKKKGFRVLGVPSNDFASQTPENDKDILSFCKLNYGVSFPITTKVSLRGPNIHPFMNEIIKASGGMQIKWNFEKFLFDRRGIFRGRFPSSINSKNKSLLEAIQKTIQ